MKAEDVFLAALEKQTPAERQAYLDSACRDDADLRAQVESLLQSHQEAGSFLDAPLFESPPTVDQPLVEKPGTRIGPYKLLQQVGEGGFGVVFMAEQLEPVRRKVALKVIKPGMDTRQVIARFEAERQALAMMDHPNIARVMDAGATASGRPYFVMELVRGVPITAYCDQNNLPVRERLTLFAAVCGAIQHAHQKGIIHRDIKPSNVLVTSQDGAAAVKVIDFGVAKAMGQQLTDKTLFTDFAQMIGTPLYMSPEQAELSGTDIDTRSDIYSLGVLLYELLTGSTPVDKEQMKKAAFDEIRRIIREEEPQKPSTRISSAEAAPSIAAQRHTEPARLAKLVRGELDWIVMKSLEKDRNRRYETANAFARDIEHFLHDEPVQACPPSAGYRFRKFARRNRAFLTMAAVVAAALLLGIAGTTWQAIRASGQRDRAVIAERLAEKKSAEAARNLREARQAVDDWFTKISQTTLLDAPGLQPLRHELLEAALTYYRGLLKQSQDNPELQADLAAAHMRLSVIYISLDRNDDAMAAMLQGLALVEQLIRQRPSDAELPQRLAGYFKWSRNLYSRSRPPKDPAQAIATLERSAEIWQQFARDNPTLSELQGDLAGMYLLLSALHQGGNAKQSLAHSQQSLDILEKLVRGRPDLVAYHDALAFTFDEHAYGLIRQGQADAAEQVGRRAVRYFEELSREHPQLWSLRLGLAKSEQALAYRIRTSQPQEAEKIYRQELELLEKLLAQSPANAHVRQQMCIAMESLAAHLQQGGRDEAAAELTGRAQSIVEKLVLDFPQASDYRERFAKGYAAQAQRLIEGQPQQAEQAYRRALTIQEQLVLDFPGQARFAEDVVVTQRRLLDLLRTANGPQGLIDLQRQMLAHSQRVAQQSPAVLTYHREVAKNHNRLGLLLREAGQSAAAEVELLKAQEVWRSRFSPKVETALKAAEADSKNVHRWHDLFLAYHGNGEWEKCLWAIGKKQEIAAPSVWEWFHESMVLWQLNQRDEARAKFHAALDAMERDDTRLAQLRGYQSEAAMLLGLPDPGLRVDRANDYSKQAGALEKAGQTAQAKEAYAKAIEVYESLAADFPLAQSYTRKLAGLLTKAGRPQEIEPAYRRAIAAIEELEQASPELRLAQANYYNDLATLLKSGQRLTEAEEAVRRAVALKQDLVRDFPGRPDLPFHLAHSYLGLCYVLQASQQTSAAAEALRQADDLLQKLAGDVAARKLLRERLGHTLWKAADSWLGMNRLDETQQSNQQALLSFGQLAAEFPATPFFRQEQAFSHRRLADVAERAKQPEKIEEHLQLAAGIYAQLLAEVPGSDFYRHEAAAVYGRLGNLLLPGQKWQEAEAEYTKAIHLSPQVGSAWSGRAYAHFHRQQWEQAAADFSKAIELTPNVHGNWWHRGHSYLHMQQWDQAAADFGKSLETWPDGGEGWYLRAIARAQLNQPDLALADLRQALAKGYLRLELLKNEPNLDPLRKTADFGKLLEELEQNVKSESK